MLLADQDTLMSKVQTPQAWVVDKEFREIKEWVLLNKLLLNEDQTQNLVCTLISEPVEDSLCKEAACVCCIVTNQNFLGGG